MLGSVVWAADNKTIFYTTEDPVSKRSDSFWRHIAGQPDSQLVYQEKDELFDVGVGRSLDRRIIFLASYSKTSAEQRYLRTDDPNGEFRADSAARSRA